MADKKEALERLKKRLKLFQSKTELAEDFMRIAPEIIESFDIDLNYEPLEILDSVRKTLPPPNMIFTNELFRSLSPLLRIRMIHLRYTAFLSSPEIQWRT